MQHTTQLHFKARTHAVKDMQTHLLLKQKCYVRSPLQTSHSLVKKTNKRRPLQCCFALPYHPVTTFICAVLDRASVASVITAAAKWPASVRCFSNRKRGRANSKLKAGHFDWLSSLVSKQRRIVGKSSGERRGENAFLLMCLKRNNAGELFGQAGAGFSLT